MSRARSKRIVAAYFERGSCAWDFPPANWRDDGPETIKRMLLMNADQTVETLAILKGVGIHAAFIEVSDRRGVSVACCRLHKQSRQPGRFQCR